MSDLVFTVDVDATSGITAINDFFSTVERGSKAASDKLRSALGDEEVEKKVIITLEGGKAVAKEVKTISSDTDKIVKAQAALNGQYGKTQQSVSQSLNLLRQIKQTTSKFGADNKTITADWKLINTRIREAEETLKGLNSTSSSFGGPIKEAMGGLTGRITAANLASNALTLGLKAVGQSLKFLFQEGLKFEQLDLQLQAFTGSAAGAESAMDSFLKTAIETPLDVMQVAQAGKTLMAFGLSADQAKDATRQLAIVAGATGGDMNNLSRNLGQIAAQGRAFTRDLNQFAVQGIPIYGQLSKVMGVSVEDVRKLAEEGKIGFPEVESALKDMTKAGSAFATIAEKMNNTFTGRIEEMVSSIQLLSGAVVKAGMELNNAFGGPITGLMGAASAAMQFLAKNMGLVTTAIKAVVIGFGSMALVIAGLNIGTTIQVIGLLGAKLMALIAPITAVIAKMIAMLALMGPAGWATLAGAVGVTTIAFAALLNETDRTKNGMKMLRDEVDLLVDDSMDATVPTAWGGVMKSLSNTITEQQEKVDQLTAKIEQYKSLGLRTTEIERQRAAAIMQLSEAQEKYNRAIENAQGKGVVGQLQIEILRRQSLIAEMENELNKRDGLLQKQREAKDAMEEEISKAKELQKTVENFFDSKINGQQKVLDDIKTKLGEEKDMYKSVEDAAKDRHKNEMSVLDEKNSKIMDAISSEISALQAKGPAERALEAYRLRELKQRRASGNLSAKEKLELDAQIERKQRQQVIEKKQLELAEKKAQAEIEKKKLLAQQKKEMDAITKKREASLDALDDLVKQQTELIKKTKDEKQARIDALQAAVDGYDDQLTTLGEIDEAIDDNIKKILEARDSYNLATRAVQDMRTKIKNASSDIKGLKIQLAQAQAAANRLKATTAGTSTRASGGPVTGGQTYTVNEMGKEAFLSASGKLSMINAPLLGSMESPWLRYRYPGSPYTAAQHS